MHLLLLLYGIFALTTAQDDLPLGLSQQKEWLYPTSTWTVTNMFSTTNATSASAGFTLIMQLPENNTLPALHQSCSRSWKRGRALLLPRDWAACEFDEKLIWRFVPGAQHVFPGEYSVQLAFWDRLGHFGETLRLKNTTIKFVSEGFPGHDAVLGDCNEDKSRCEYEVGENAPAPPLEPEVNVFAEDGPRGLVSKVSVSAPSANGGGTCVFNFTLVNPFYRSSDPPSHQREDCHVPFPCDLHGAPPGATTNFTTICNARGVRLEVHSYPEELTVVRHLDRKYTVAIDQPTTIFFNRAKDPKDALTTNLTTTVVYSTFVDFDYTCNEEWTLCTWFRPEVPLIVERPKWNGVQQLEA